MPAAAVIPAPKGYINVVAVKKLVVEFCCGRCFVHEISNSFAHGAAMISVELSFVSLVNSRGISDHSVTESKLECSKQA